MPTAPLSHSLMRATTSNLAMQTSTLVLPASMRTLAGSRAVLSRCLSTDAPRRAATGTAASSSPTDKATTSPPRPTRAPYSNEEISASLGDIVGSLHTARGPRNPWRSPRSTNTNTSPSTSTSTSPSSAPSSSGMADRQTNIADSMGLRFGVATGEAGRLVRLRGDPPPAPVRLDAYVGRTVRVNENAGLGAAIRMMEIQMHRDGVRREHNQQRFYERPGLKRKRLRSARWRKRFKVGFQATVEKVKGMRRMGW